MSKLKLINSNVFSFFSFNVQANHTEQQEIFEKIVGNFYAILLLSGAISKYRLGWGSNRGVVVFFWFKFLTGVVLGFLGGGVVFKTGVAFKPIR